MKKGYLWLRYLIQGAMIVVSIAALVIFRLFVVVASDVNGLYPFTDVILAVPVVCLVLIFVTQHLFSKRDELILLHEYDEDLIKLQTKAQTDHLTGLLNREAAIDQITRFLDAESLQSHTLLIIDLDNFKSINDNFGHFEGDKVLKTLSAKLKSVFRNIDIVGRLGGDEFIVLMKYTMTTNIIRKKALELKSALEYIASGGDISVTVTGSIGISTYDGDRKTFETLYKEGDEALYRAKLAGKNKYCFYDESEANDYSSRRIDDRRMVLAESSAFIQLQALIDNIDGGIALLEIGDDIKAVYLSHSYVKLMQVSYFDVKAADNKVFDFIHKDDINQVAEMLRQGATSDKSVEAVFRRLSDSGKTKWHHIRAVRIQYEDSDKPVLLAIVTDVTNLKESALNFQAQKRQLETVLRISRVVTFEVDIARRTLYVTDPTITKYGIDVHAIENMPEVLIEAGVIHPDSIDECRRMYDEIYSGVPQGSAIIRTLKRDGQYTIERFTYFTVFDDSGCPVKAVGVDEGIETRSDIKLRVDLIERQFINYADNMLTIIKVIVDTDIFEFLKPEFIPEEIEINIKTYTDLLEYRIAQIIDPADRLLIKTRFGISGMKKDLQEGDVISHEYRIRDSGGSVKWYSMVASTYVDQFNGEGYTFIRTRDITFRKNLEQSLNEEIVRNSGAFMYTFDIFEKLSELYFCSEDRNKDCAIVLLTLRNYDYLLEQYGRIMMNDMLIGFIGKIMTIITADHLPCLVDQHTVSLLIPEADSEEMVNQLVEKIIKFLRSPVYFQFHEEVFMEFSCGASISDKKTTGFKQLYDEAANALRSLDTNGDAYIRFFHNI